MPIERLEVDVPGIDPLKRVLGTGDTTTRGSVAGDGKLRTMQVPATEAPKN